MTKISNKTLIKILFLSGFCKNKISLYDKDFKRKNLFCKANKPLTKPFFVRSQLLAGFHPFLLTLLSGQHVTREAVTNIGFVRDSQIMKGLTIDLDIKKKPKAMLVQRCKKEALKKFLKLNSLNIWKK